MNILELSRQVAQAVMVRMSEGAARRAAIERAYRKFTRRYPEWAAALFDEHFLRHTAEPMLRSALSGNSSIDPAELALAWSRQLWASSATRRNLAAELTPIAAKFLGWIELDRQTRPMLVRTDTQPA